MIKIRNNKEEIFGKHHRLMQYIPIVKKYYNGLEELSDSSDEDNIIDVKNNHEHRDYRRCKMKFCLDSKGKNKSYQFERNKWSGVISKVYSYNFGGLSIRVIFKVGPILVSKRKINRKHNVFINLKIVQIEAIKHYQTYNEYMFEPEYDVPEEFIWHMPKKYYFEPSKKNLTHELYNEVQQRENINNKYFRELLKTDGVNKHYTDIFGRTLLHMAIKYKNLKKAKRLLDHYLDVNAVDNKGYTPLHYACTIRNEEYVKLLLKYNADMNIRDNKDRKPYNFTYIGSSCRRLFKKEKKRKKSLESLKVLCLDKISLMQTEGKLRDLSKIPYMLLLYPDNIEPKAIRGVRWNY